MSCTDSEITGDQVQMENYECLVKLPTPYISEQDYVK